MADQTIALQARAPQGNSMAAAIRQNSQLMNMMTQQAAAQRQTQQAQQAMDIARAQETRAVAGEERAVSAAEIKMAGDTIDLYIKRAPQTMNQQGYELYLADMDQDAPKVAAAFRANMAPENFDRGVFLQMVGSVADNFKANFGDLKNELVYNANGTVSVARTGGVGGPGREPGVFELRQYKLRQGGAARPAPSGNPAPQAMGGNSMANPSPSAPSREDVLSNMGQPLPPNVMRDNGFQPMSMTTGGGDQAAQQDLGAIVQTALDTGVISQSGYDAMRAAAPGKEDQLTQILSENNIQIMPNEGGAPGMSNAVLRSDDATPQLLNVQSMDDYYDTGQAAQGYDRTQGPIPGSSKVPIPRVRAEAQAGRPSPQEAYNTQRAQKQADADVQFMEKAPGAMRTVATNLKVLDRMIGDASVDEKTNAVIYPTGGRRPHPGFDQTVGVGFPGLRFLEGSPQADFDAMLKQVTGGTFLEAFETLKGGGPITQPEGEKATTAISRLGRNISEKEFIIALNELRSLMRDRLQRAETRIARLSGNATPSRGGVGAAPRATKTTSSGW